MSINRYERTGHGSAEIISTTPIFGTISRTPQGRSYDKDGEIRQLGRGDRDPPRDRRIRSRLGDRRTRTRESANGRVPWTVMDRTRAAEVEQMIDAEFLCAESSVDHSPPSSGRIILVDAFNVLHAVLLGKNREQGWWRREERERLLRRISTWQSGPDEIWVAFDGTQPAWSVWAEPVLRPMTSATRGPTIHSVFVESADNWIVRRARRAAQASQMIIVSGDRKVTGRARSAGCEVWTPWAFMSRCTGEPNRSEVADSIGAHRQSTEPHR
jgi:hypothetical protein